jgi:hypothetical protein
MMHITATVIRFATVSSTPNTCARTARSHFVQRRPVLAGAGADGEHEARDARQQPEVLLRHAQRNRQRRVADAVANAITIASRDCRKNSRGDLRATQASASEYVTNCCSASPPITTST